jgi:hypothetical protein
MELINENHIAIISASFVATPCPVLASIMAASIESSAATNFFFNAQFFG